MSTQLPKLTMWADSCASPCCDQAGGLHNSLYEIPRGSHNVQGKQLTRETFSHDINTNRVKWTACCPNPARGRELLTLQRWPLLSSFLLRLSLFSLCDPNFLFLLFFLTKKS